MDQPSVTVINKPRSRRLVFDLVLDTRSLFLYTGLSLAMMRWGSLEEAVQVRPHDRVRQERTCANPAYLPVVKLHAM
jgi:hypothetical protein